MRISCKYYILQYLKKHGKTPGGTIEREISAFTTYKPSNISRRLREMENDSQIVRTTRKIGNSPHFVVYDLSEYERTKQIAY